MAIDEKNVRRGGPGRIWAGLFLLAIGGVLLLDQMGFPLPDWLFSWHVLLIAFGLFIGLRHNFRGGAWLIMIIVGGAFLLQDYYPDMHLYRYILPCVLIYIGLAVILKPNRQRYGQEWRDDWRQERHRLRRERREHRWGNRSYGYGGDPNSSNPGTDVGSGTGSSNPGAAFGPEGTNPGSGSGYGRTTFSSSSRESYSSEDFIDTTSIFGGVHKKVMSKNFKGGDITTMMGGTEIDLTQADFTGTIRLDITQIMGGTKIIVPPHWEVRSEVTAVFAGFEDKRQQPAIINPDKVLIIDGTSIFAGIELKNY